MPRVQTNRWPSMLLPLLFPNTKSTNLALYKCPTDPKGNTAGSRIGGPDTHPAEYTKRSYVINGWNDYFRTVVEPSKMDDFRKNGDRGYRVGCVTNSAGVIARAVLDAKGLTPLLDIVLGADQVARAKPAPDLVLAAMAELGTEPSHTVLVGDSRYDVACARAAGVAAIVVGGGAEGDHAIANLDELAPLLARLLA